MGASGISRRREATTARAVASRLPSSSVMTRAEAAEAAGAARGGRASRRRSRRLSDAREPAANTIVATSIGEEGLDIPAVDLIVFFDVVDIIRTIQRMGRTVARDGRWWCWRRREGGGSSAGSRQLQPHAQVFSNPSASFRRATTARECYPHTPGASSRNSVPPRTSSGERRNRRVPGSPVNPAEPPPPPPVRSPFDRGTRPSPRSRRLSSAPTTMNPARCIPWITGAPRPYSAAPRLCTAFRTAAGPDYSRGSCLRLGVYRRRLGPKGSSSAAVLWRARETPRRRRRWRDASPRRRTPSGRRQTRARNSGRGVRAADGMGRRRVGTRDAEEKDDDGASAWRRATKTTTTMPTTTIRCRETKTTTNGRGCGGRFMCGAGAKEGTDREDGEANAATNVAKDSDANVDANADAVDPWRTRTPTGATQRLDFSTQPSPRFQTSRHTSATATATTASTTPADAEPCASPGCAAGCSNCRTCPSRGTGGALIREPPSALAELATTTERVVAATRRSTKPARPRRRNRRSTSLARQSQSLSQPRSQPGHGRRRRVDDETLETLLHIKQRRPPARSEEHSSGSTGRTAGANVGRGGGDGAILRRSGVRRWTWPRRSGAIGGGGGRRVPATTHKAADDAAAVDAAAMPSATARGDARARDAESRRGRLGRRDAEDGGTVGSDVPSARRHVGAARRESQRGDGWRRDAEDGGAPSTPTTRVVGATQAMANGRGAGGDATRAKTMTPTSGVGMGMGRRSCRSCRSRLVVAPSLSGGGWGITSPRAARMASIPSQRRRRQVACLRATIFGRPAVRRRRPRHPRVRGPDDRQTS